MNTSYDIKKILELIDLYKYGSIAGEKVEIVVSPLMENGDSSKRLITIELQGGVSREKDTFVVENGKEFDEKVLPLIISHYTKDDSLTKWNIVNSGLDGITIKGNNETESGNLLYVETFNPNLYSEISNKCEELATSGVVPKEDTTSKEKIWDEILKYVKNRRISNDFYHENTFTDEEKTSLYSFVRNVAENEKSVRISNSRDSKEKNENLLKDIFSDDEKLSKYEFNKELSSKIISENYFKKVASLIAAEKRVRKRLDFSNESIVGKINFAINELEKIGYFDLKNNMKKAAVEKLKSTYEPNTDNYNYCEEFLTYLESKENKLNKSLNLESETPQVTFEVYDDVVVDSYDKFNEALELVKNGKLSNERYEVFIEPYSNDYSMRKVRISLLGGVSRKDTFEFLFTDGAKFDEYFEKALEDIRKDNPNFMTEVYYYKGFALDSVHTLRDNDQVKIKNPSLDLAYRRNKESVNVLDKFRKIKNSLGNDDKKNIELSSNNSKKNSIIEKFKAIEREIIEKSKNSEKEIDTSVSFEELHNYVLNYKISNIDNLNNTLIIYKRDDNSVYEPTSEAEKRNIKFAYYWAAMVGIDDSKNELFAGEKSAFSDDNKKLYDLMNVQFKESLKRGIDVDFDSLKEQFINSGVENANKIFDRLFKNDDYVKYVTLYYKKSLGLESEKKEELENILSLAKQYAIDIQNKNEQEELKEAALDLAKKIIEESEHDYLVQEAEKFAKKILSSNNNDIKELVEDLVRRIQKVYEQIVLIDGAHEQAKRLYDKALNEELKLAASELAKKIIEESEQEELKEEAREFAKKLFDENQHEMLLEEAHLFAKKIIEESEQEEIKLAAKELARNIINEAELEEIKNGAEETAKKIINEAELEEIKNGAEETARKIINEAELEEIKNGAEETARKIYNDAVVEDLKVNALEQAKLLLEKEKENLFDIVEPKEEQSELSPELRELADAVEVVDSYAEQGQPSIKVFFDRGNKEAAEVIISNGIAENEEVMYRRTFNVKKLETEIIPLFCELYAKNNDVTFNRMFDVPNTSIAGLVAVGSMNRTFQVSNAEKSFVEMCRDTLVNKINEVQKENTKKL